MRVDKGEVLIRCKLRGLIFFLVYIVWLRHLLLNFNLLRGKFFFLRMNNESSSLLFWIFLFLFFKAAVTVQV